MKKFVLISLLLIVSITQYAYELERSTLLISSIKVVQNPTDVDNVYLAIQAQANKVEEAVLIMRDLTGAIVYKTMIVVQNGHNTVKVDIPVPIPSGDYDIEVYDSTPQPKKVHFTIKPKGSL